MPPFTARIVKVASHTLHTTLSLEQMRDLLATSRPGSNHSSGWGSSYDQGTSLGPDGTVGTGTPSVEVAFSDVPRRLAARYFSWSYESGDGSGQTSGRNWVLDGIDILVSESGSQSYLVLYSTTDNDFIDIAGGELTRSLLANVRASDPSASISEPTALNFSSPDVYLWLAQQADTQQPLAGATKVRSLSRVSAEEDRRRYRSSTLSGDVDMQRITFLNAVAEGSALGPAVLTMSQPNAKGKIELVQARVWRDGSFGLLMTSTVFRDIVDGDVQRLEAVYRLAYRYLPLINASYAQDAAWGDKDRDWLIIGKRVELARHYRALAESHERWAEYEAETGQ